MMATSLIGTFIYFAMPMTFEVIDTSQSLSRWDSVQADVSGTSILQKPLLNP